MQSLATKNSDLRIAQTLRTIAVDRSIRGSLVAQIVTAIESFVQDGALAAGDRMPSVRNIARQLQVSTFTIVEAYERLIAAGCLVSRRGSGYFVARRDSPALERRSAGDAIASPASELPPSLSSDPYMGNSGKLPVGVGWLPAHWYGDRWIQDATRQAVRINPDRLQGYGNSLGFSDLRALLARRWQQTIPTVYPENILLTRGATHALDLLLQALTQPGDSVFVEDPGFPPLSALIEHHGCTSVPVPRDAAGLDLVAMEKLATEMSPKLAFVTTVLHNPLGTSLDAAQAHRLLRLAEQFDFWLVEDDTFRELSVLSAPSLAAMDGLRRTIRVDSTSKTLSPFIRIGSICASDRLIAELTRIKMVTGLTSSELDERVACCAISSVEYRRAVARLQTRLENATAKGIDWLHTMGLTPIATPQGGMFIAARLSRPDTPPMSGNRIAQLGAANGLLLAPASMFSKGSDAPWFRFNVAHLENPMLHRFFAKLQSGTLEG
jgi:DNA-binding transcriptional MocR family regulator